jgi:hypothetical protein
VKLSSRLSYTSVPNVYAGPSLKVLLTPCALGSWSVARYVLSSCVDDENHKATKGTKDRMK